MSKEARFLIELFSEFELLKIRWAILRNSEEIPNNIGNDVDILIDNKLLGKARNCVLKVASSHNMPVIGVIKKYRYICVLLKIKGQNRLFLPIDLMGGCFTRGTENVNSKFGLDNRVFLNDIWVVPNGFEAAATLMKELLPHSVVDERCRPAILNGVNSDPKNFLNALKGILAPQISNKLSSYCLKGDWDSVAQMSIQVRQDINSSYLKRLCQVPEYIYATIKHYSYPDFSCFVVIIGPDGSGKTTIANELIKRLKKSPFKITKHVPTNFGVLPRLAELKFFFYKLFGRNLQPLEEPVPGEYLSGMKNPVHSPLKGSVYVLWYGIDMFLGKLLLRRWRGQGGLVVFARYYYDYYFQSAHCNTPKWVKDLVGTFVPVPDLVFSIQRSPQDIFDGKPELTVQEIKRQQEAIANLMHGFDNAYVLEGSSGVDSTAQQAEKIIVDYLENKFKDI